MLRSVIAWLDNYLEGEGSPAVAKAVVGIMSFAVLVGAILGNAAVKAGLLVAVIFVALAAMLILLADRRRIVSQSNSYKQLLTRYCKFIVDQKKPAMRISRLEHVAVIDKSGDTTEVIKMHVVVLKKELYFVPLRFGSAWEQPHKYRKRLKVEVRSLLVEGNRGTEWEVTESWLPDGKLDLLSHLHSPAPQGSEVKLEVDRAWPGKCIPLVRGRPETFTLQFARPIDYASYVVVLPPGAEAYYDPIGFSEGQDGFSLTSKRNNEGRLEFTLVATCITYNQKVGMRLQLKNGGPR